MSFLLNNKNGTIINVSLLYYNYCMQRLKVSFETLDGNYSMVILDDHTYSIETTIEVLENKNGVIENYDEFIFNLNEVNIFLWDKVYKPNGLEIEDAIKWSVTLDDNLISGVEGYWPYTYDKLIDTLMMVDDKIVYFKANNI